LRLADFTEAKSIRTKGKERKNLANSERNNSKSH
jgi:hypothetical protein